MSDSLEVLLGKREQQNAAIREALSLYPDLRYEGDHLVSDAVRPEDCDRIYLVPDRRLGADFIRLGKKVGPITVLCSTQNWLAPAAYSFFRGLKNKHHDLYSQLVKLLAESRGAL